jgi:RNA polymerase sigma factor (sigma-70 family)
LEADVLKLATEPTAPMGPQGVTAWDFDSKTMPYVDSLYNTAYRMTGNSQDAEDLVQETFFKAYKYYDKFEEGTNLKAWLFKILKNTFINNYRKKKLEPKSVEFSEIEESFERIVRHDPDDAPLDPEAQYLSSIMDEGVKKALESSIARWERSCRASTGGGSCWRRRSCGTRSPTATSGEGPRPGPASKPRNKGLPGGSAE